MVGCAGHAQSKSAIPIPTLSHYIVAKHSASVFNGKSPYYKGHRCQGRDTVPKTPARHLFLHDPKQGAPFKIM
jgi:hypothetical protein